MMLYILIGLLTAGYLWVSCIGKEKDKATIVEDVLAFALVVISWPVWLYLIFLEKRKE